MTERNKRLLFLLLTLPGAAVPFLDFIAPISPLEALVQIVEEIPADTLFLIPVVVVFAPLILVLLDVYRVSGYAIARPVTWLICLYGLVVSATQFVFGLGGYLYFELYVQRETTVIAAASIAATAALVAYGWRRKTSIEGLAEVSLMGAFISVGTTYVWEFGVVYGIEEHGTEFFFKTLDLDAGGYVALFTCLVFVVRIFDILRHPVVAKPV